MTSEMDDKDWFAWAVEMLHCKRGYRPAQRIDQMVAHYQYHLRDWYEDART